MGMGRGRGSMPPGGPRGAIGPPGSPTDHSRFMHKRKAARRAEESFRRMDDEEGGGGGGGYAGSGMGGMRGKPLAKELVFLERVKARLRSRCAAVLGECVGIGGSGRSVREGGGVVCRPGCAPCAGAWVLAWLLWPQTCMLPTHPLSTFMRPHHDHVCDHPPGSCTATSSSASTCTARRSLGGTSSSRWCQTSLAGRPTSWSVQPTAVTAIACVTASVAAQHSHSMGCDVVPWLAHADVHVVQWLAC